ncbi:MAG: hypothetical protein QGG36_16925 [Pirellulaceae bacterium]|jgi:hypothetical protein|nr:hypothetical protein [Pirellulaceae bacterium]MDP7017491.1 hypothetical protein [Pirellulaceae bacterium]
MGHATLGEFIDGVLDSARVESHNPVGRKMLCQTEDLCDAVWRAGNARFPKASSLLSDPDPVLRTFASTLRGSTRVLDLREPAWGDGFEWSRLNALRTPLHRAAEQLVFGIESPPGILRR